MLQWVFALNVIFQLLKLLLLVIVWLLFYFYLNFIVISVFVSHTMFYVELMHLRNWLY